MKELIDSSNISTYCQWSKWRGTRGTASPASDFQSV